jgi:hypothetical protein
MKECVREFIFSMVNHIKVNLEVNPLCHSRTVLFFIIYVTISPSIKVLTFLRLSLLPENRKQYTFTTCIIKKMAENINQCMV